MTATRRAALSVLRQVLDRHRPLDEVLGGAVGPFEPRDRAFVHALVAATLRHRGRIDALLDRCITRPLPHKARPVRHVLRFGVAQLFVLDLPPHAAVSTAVELCAAAGQAGHTGLVNGVLRRLDREGRAWWAAQDGARLNTPDWLWESWTAAYGAAQARAIAEAHQGPAPLDLTLRTPAEADAWAERLGGLRLPTGSVRLSPDHPLVTTLTGYDDGAWWVQDAAAALPARLLRAGPGMRVLDACAAPGGKTLQLAAAGAQVVARDRSAGRLARVSENLARTGLSATLEVADAGAPASDPAPGAADAPPFDAVLLDAPCSATGTLRRHPDVLWLKRPQDVAALAATQTALLRRALDQVRPGGTVVYCVCSLQPEEGPEVVGSVLADDPRVSRVPVSADEIGGDPAWITPDGDLRTLPSHLPEVGGMDGFYAARLVRCG